MIARSTLWILIAMLAHPQGARRAPVVMMPVPDAAWWLVRKAGAQAGAGDPIAVKRAASVAHQSGELRVSAVVGGERAESLLVAGANRLLLGTSPFLGTSPGDRDAYLARACWFNGQGVPVRRILLLESRLTEPSVEVAKSLLAAQRDFDLADAAALEKHGQAHGASIDRELQVGQAHYSVVVVAPSDAWPEASLDILQDFIVGGGKVVFLGRQPLSIQRLLLRTGVVRVSDSPEDIERGLNFAISRDFHVSEVTGGSEVLDAPLPNIRYQHRQDARRHYFYVANLDPEHAVTVRLGMVVSGAIEEWDLVTGRITPLRMPVKEIPAGGSVAMVVVK
jgi:hypothetical protein